MPQPENTPLSRCVTLLSRCVTLGQAEVRWSWVRIRAVYFFSGVTVMWRFSGWSARTCRIELKL